MGWQVNLSNMKSVHSFAQAEEVWKNAKVWKNQHTGWRPLDSSRKHHIRICRNESKTGVTYDCVLYNTIMVAYHNDGRVHLNTHHSHASREFCWHVAPEGCTVVSHKSRMFWQVMTPSGLMYYQSYSSDEPLILEPVSRGVWRLLSRPYTHEEQTLDRKLAAQARARIKLYVGWHKLTSRLGGIRPGYGSKHIREQCARAFVYSAVKPEEFPEIASYGLSPEFLRPLTYAAIGAITKHPAPHDRLPRI